VEDGSNPLRPAGGRTEARRRRSRRANPDGTMTLIEHLYELRYRLGLAAVGVVVGGILGFLWWSYQVGPIPSLGQLVTGPYCSLPTSTRVTFGNHPCSLLQTKPFEGFSIRLKVGVAMGVVLSSPVWLYQVWAFITPGLYRKERRFALTFVFSAVILFLAGALAAYLVVPKALRVLTGVGGSEFVTALAGTDYVGFMVALLAIFGASFELPLLVVMLNRIGMVKYQQLKKWRRGMIFALFVFAAFATPGQDPISMLVLAGGLTVLLEASVQISRVHDRRKARQELASEEFWEDEANRAMAQSHGQPTIPPASVSTGPSDESGGPVSYDDAT
jgi:sec-independent protein translocase protein TatC